ncbi:H-type lectin domain-containing protein [Pseudogemmobacter faecipullorum]|uniref:H-type lectin domain-containing protein n=1 Tax=Pseudogemmobacter faecipullorum TaxID=2755041 RepID=A0ABS8CHU6_9RHOB|nr:H-type lectin domain-containing protein [Pseudogemmobacter faecipullorum]MCB5408963.1 H-type lectin domain-containing protein [Pseudogemmobacter faecipullorum]
MLQLNAPVGILQGSEILFADFATGGPMWVGEGPREVRSRVSFPQPFQAPPAVMAGLSMWDLDHRTNSRIDLSTAAVTAEGFDLVFRTWGDSRIARIRASWTAIGQLRDAEQWQVD